MTNPTLLRSECCVCHNDIVAPRELLDNPPFMCSGCCTFLCFVETLPFPDENTAYFTRPIDFNSLGRDVRMETVCGWVDAGIRIAAGDVQGLKSRLDVSIEPVAMSDVALAVSRAQETGALEAARLARATAGPGTPDLLGQGLPAPAQAELQRQRKLHKEDDDA